MIESRYLVFVSSTFRDLEEERKSVTSAILELNWFPSGMEVFPASNATPWALIERMIRDADYYILIIGGMYGSTDEEGVSYTEREYDYAVTQGIPVLAFLPANPKDIPAGKTELDAKVRKKLEKFQSKVKRHHCKFWGGPEDLKAKVLVSLVQEAIASPRPGWVRKDQQDSAETLKKLSDALARNIELEARNRILEATAVEQSSSDPSLARDDDNYVIFFNSRDEKPLKLTWREIWGVFAPRVLAGTVKSSAEIGFSQDLRTYLLNNNLAVNQSYRVSSRSYEVIVNQFLALGYLEPTAILSEGKSRPGYRATPKGVTALSMARAVRREPTGLLLEPIHNETPPEHT